MHSSTEELRDIPAPDDEQRRISERVLDQLRLACEDAGGVLSFAEYMNLALYAPGSGYYSGGAHKFGEQGDFITAPEVSALFSQCLANQVAAVFGEIGRCSLVEFGAGSGVMAADILSRLETLDSLPACYLILEVSAELRQRQQQTIEQIAPHLLGLVSWLDAVPDDIGDAVVLANEVLDAMPVECFRKADAEVEQLVIGIEHDGIRPGYRPAPAALKQAVEEVEQRIGRTLPDGYCSEVNLNISPWLGSVFDAVGRGVLLLIDYGYYAGEYYMAQRDRGTLLCHYRHRAHGDPFWYPGLQDITASVDFTAVAHAAADAGFHVAGYTTQAAFLMGCGLAELHQEQVGDDIVDQVSLSQQIKTLTLPSEMGERFKVMALCKGYDAPLTGFMLQDHRGKL